MAKSILSSLKVLKISFTGTFKGYSMYTCRRYGRWIFYYIVSSFELANELWSTERAYSANSLIYTVVLSKSCRVMNPSGGARMKGESEKLGKLISCGIWWKNQQSAAAITFIARATLRFISRNSSRWSRWQGMGQDNWPLPEKRLLENNADRRRKEGNDGNERYP